jgi:hypothetical protein
MEDHTSSHLLQSRVRAIGIGTAGAALALVVGLTACAVPGQPPQHSCSPSYVDRNQFGRISAQQEGPGAGLAWGVYPSRAFVRIVVRVYAGSRKVDGKDQAYAAHGSVPASKIRKAGAGAVFRIEGETYDAGAHVASFYLTCGLV